MIQLSSDHLNTRNMCADNGALLQFNDKIDKSKSSVLLKFVFKCWEFKDSRYIFKVKSHI